MNDCKCGCLNIKVILEDESVNIPIEIGNPIEHTVIPDVYEGSYDIAPSTEEIILQTKNKTLTNDITVEPIPDEYIVPQGMKVIKEGGIYDIKQYETANVLTNIQSLSVMPSEQAQTFTLNNENISGYNPVVVNPIPSEYIIPTGVETINIIENGTVSRDVTSKEAVTINVNIQNEDYDNALTAFGVESDLADGISALTEYSNEITGEQDETLSDAVRSLADGFGGEWGDGVLIFDHTFDEDTSQYSITTLPNGEPFSFDRIVCKFDFPDKGINSGWRQYWRSDLPVTGNPTYMVQGGVAWLNYSGEVLLRTVNEFTITGDEIELKSYGYDRNNAFQTSAQYKIVDCGTYNKITAYAWWSHVISAGTHVTITGYNRKQEITNEKYIYRNQTGKQGRRYHEPHDRN